MISEAVRGKHGNKAAHQQSAPIAAAVFAAIALFMSGCADTGKIAPRDNAIEHASLNAGAAIRAAAGEAGWPDVRWWTAYGDTQLSRLVESAIAGNPSLAVARARVREAQSLTDEARAGLMPQIDGTTSISRQHFPDNAYYGPGTFRDRTAWNNTVGLTLSYDLDLWHANRNAHESAFDGARAEACVERAAQLMLEVSVVSDYGTLAEEYQLRDIAAATLEQHARSRISRSIALRAASALNWT
jgi:outer membrane protein TolC